MSDLLKLFSFSNLIKAIRNPRLLLDYIYKIYFHKLIPKKILKRNQLGAYYTYSQAYQDIFVREMLNKKNYGVYVEVGAYDEIDHSNTFVLETQNKWSGFSLEIDSQAVSDFNKIRKNKCICVDATLFDFEQHFKKLDFPKQIDYLSLDIEPANQTLAVLKHLPLNSYRFSVITYEHDNYVSGPDCMYESRKIFESHGYKLVVSNVQWNGRDFEDWYIDPSVVPKEIWSRFQSNNIDCLDVFRRTGIL